MTARTRLAPVAPLAALAVGCAALAAPAAGQDKKDHGPLTRLTVTSGGDAREALVHYPGGGGKKGGKDKQPDAPVVLVFHGHGHTMRDAAEGFGLHRHWDDAVCVYPQGVDTPTPNDPAGKHPGWKVDGPRDYRFVDELLAAVGKKHPVDHRRVFAAGFSNGAYFCYGLWAHRGDKLRAIAPCAGTHERVEGAWLKKLDPLPCLQIAGRKDNKCLFEKQEEAVRLVRQVNGCPGDGTAWPPHNSPLDGKMYPSNRNAPTVFLVHDGGHAVPDGAGRLIVEFFQQVAKK